MNGPDFGLHLNLGKCEVFWPSGNQSFPELPSQSMCLREGIELLGSPIYGTEKFAQSHLSNLNNPQVELQLLRSCLSICKINYNHLLRTVPPDLLMDELTRFDLSLRHLLERITHSSIQDKSWLQATMPIRWWFGPLRSFSFICFSFIGSCNTSRNLTQSFLQQLNESLTTKSGIISVSDPIGRRTCSTLLTL